MLHKNTVYTFVGRLCVYVGVLALVAYSIGPILLIFLSSFRVKQDFFDFPPTFSNKNPVPHRKKNRIHQRARIF